MKKFIGGCAVVTLGVSLLALGPARASNPSTPASAAPSESELGSDIDLVHDLPDVAAPSIGDPLTSAEMEDLATVAETRGMTLDQAVLKRGPARDFSLLAGELERRFPDDFAGARFDPSGGHQIAWRAEAPTTSAALISQFETSDSTRGVELHGIQVVENRGFSQAVLHERVTDLHMKLWDDHAVQELSTEADPITGRIDVLLRPSDIFMSEETVVNGLRERHSIDDMVEFRVTRDDIAADHGTQYGGEVMSTCTSGFTVDHPTNFDGIATAGHCGNNQSMDGDNFPTTYNEHQGVAGDMQVHTNTTNSSFPDDFYSGSSTTLEVNRRDVSSVGTPTVGQDVCRNGMTTHKHCDEIKALGHCVNGSCNLVRVYNDTASGGDSGGSVYWGNTAYGLHKGNNWHDWARRDVFTRADKIPSGVGYTVRS